MCGESPSLACNTGPGFTKDTSIRPRGMTFGLQDLHSSFPLSTILSLLVPMMPACFNVYLMSLPTHSLCVSGLNLRGEL